MEIKILNSLSFSKKIPCKIKYLSSHFFKKKNQIIGPWSTDDPDSEAWVCGSI